MTCCREICQRCLRRVWCGGHAYGDDVCTSNGQQVCRLIEQMRVLEERFCVVVKERDQWRQRATGQATNTVAETESPKAPEELACADPGEVCERCGKAADHAEWFFKKRNIWCEQHTPWSGHYEFCRKSMLNVAKK